jgi:hypothetical protein
MKKQLLSRKRLTTLFYSLCLTLLCLSSAKVHAQIATDGDYRSKASGTWSDIAMWETRTAGTWADATVAPSATSSTVGNNVYIQAGHTVTLDGAASCLDLHMTNAALTVLALGANNINVNGKMRAYTAAGGVVTGSADGTFYTQVGSVASFLHAITASTGLIKIVGQTRTVFAVTDWTGSGNFASLDFNLDNGATASVLSTIKFQNVTILNGTTVSGDSKIGVATDTGNITIKSGGKLLTTRSGQLFNGAASANKCGTVTIESGATLELKSSAPTIDCSAFVNQGTVIYDRGTQSQTFLTKGIVGGSVEIVQYNNIILNGGALAGNKTTSIAAGLTSANYTVAGTFTMNGGNFTLGLGNTLTFANGSSIIRTLGNLNASSGIYVFGNDSAGVISVTIAGTPLTSSSELPASPLGILNLTINPGVTYSLTGSTGTNKNVNNLVLSATSSIIEDTAVDISLIRTITVKGNITGTGTSTLDNIIVSGNIVSSNISGAAITNLHLNDSDGFALTGSPTISGVLTLTAGTLTTGANTLTLGGTPVVVAGSIDASNASATVTFANPLAVVLPATPLFTGNVQNLTINGAGGVTLGSATSLAGKLTLTSGALATGGLLTLKSGDCCTSATVAQVTGGSVTGNVIVERNIPAGFRAYRLLSPSTTGGTINANWQEGGLVTSVGGISNPFLTFGTHITGAGGSANGFDTTTSNAASIFTYDNTTPAYTALANTSGTLTAGSPYLVYIRGSRLATNIDASLGNDVTTLRTTGALTTGTVAVSGLNALANGFSIVGNPYQAQVDMNKVLVTNATAVNLAPFYYVVDPKLGGKGAYATVDLVTPGSSTALDANQYLQPGQACFVQTVAASAASLSFTEADKFEGTQTSVFRTKNIATARLLLTLNDASAKALDRLVVAFDASDSNAVNQNDASKLTNFDESMATSNTSKLFAIEKRAIPTDTDEIPLNITKYRGTSYTIKAESTGLTGPTPYLLDQYTTTTTEIPQDGSVNYAYTVDVAIPASIAADRFKLIYAKSLKTIDNELAGFALYPNPSKSNSFSVAVPQSEAKVSLSVRNLLGQLLYSQNDLQSGTTAKVTVSNVKTSGVYLVSLTAEGKTATTKWIVE